MVRLLANVENPASQASLILPNPDLNLSSGLMSNPVRRLQK
jgi:hypothetical protein